MLAELLREEDFRSSPNCLREWTTVGKSCKNDEDARVASVFREGDARVR